MSSRSESALRKHCCGKRHCGPLSCALQPHPSGGDGFVLLPLGRPVSGRTDRSIDPSGRGFTAPACCCLLRVTGERYLFLPPQFTDLHLPSSATARAARRAFRRSSRRGRQVPAQPAETDQVGAEGRNRAVDRVVRTLLQRIRSTLARCSVPHHENAFCGCMAMLSVSMAPIIIFQTHEARRDLTGWYGTQVMVRGAIRYALFWRFPRCSGTMTRFTISCR